MFVFVFDMCDVQPVHNQNHFVYESTKPAASQYCENLLINFLLIFSFC